MELEKKAWVTPELIVLLRGRPEEAVLYACKGGYRAAAPSNTFGSCWGAGCAMCSELLLT
jgi:hypothetical protein